MEFFFVSLWLFLEFSGSLILVLKKKEGLLSYDVEEKDEDLFKDGINY